MKVEIYGNVRGTPNTHRIWVGNLSALPRPDDAIVIDPDRSSLYVRTVTIEVATDSATIVVSMSDDDYPEV